MQIDQKQQSAKIGDPFSVKFQSLYRCSSNRRDAYQFEEIVTPAKMFSPIVSSGMVEKVKVTRNGVPPLSECRFEVVATLTGKR